MIGTPAAATPAPQLMGILNVTPDSFSDGGRYLDPRAAVERALQMVADGASFIDMGAESTRPGSREVPAREQLRRLLPVLGAFRKHSTATISIDTRSAKVAEACLAEGAEIINDVSALHHDPRMADVVAKSSCRVILMHMRGTPLTMRGLTLYKEGVVRAVLAYFRERIRFCERAGINRERLFADPGIGFAKTPEQSLRLLNRLSDLAVLKLPLVVGLSRKSFLGQVTGEALPERRVVSSVVAGLWTVARGAQILRVHDVAEHRAALQVLSALEAGGLPGGMTEAPGTQRGRKRPCSRR